MCVKRRLLSAFMLVVMCFCFLAANPINGTADELITQGKLFSGPGSEYSVIEQIDGDADIQVYGEINDWYIVYNKDSGNVGCMAKDDAPANTDKTESSLPETFLNYTNSEREKAGLPLVQLDNDLCKAANEKAADMVRNNYFSHYSETLGSPFELLKKCGINFTKATENLSGNSSAEGAFYSWMNTDGNRNTIPSSDYTRMGIGICNSPLYGQFFVQILSN